jgi:hypothetical protein
VAATGRGALVTSASRYARSHPPACVSVADQTALLHVSDAANDARDAPAAGKRYSYKVVVPRKVGGHICAPSQQ